MAARTSHHTRGVEGRRGGMLDKNSLRSPENGAIEQHSLAAAAAKGVPNGSSAKTIAYQPWIVYAINAREVKKEILGDDYF